MKPAIDVSVLRAIQAWMLFCLITFWLPLATLVYWLVIR